MKKIYIYVFMICLCVSIFPSIGHALSFSETKDFYGSGAELDGLITRTYLEITGVAKKDGYSYTQTIPGLQTPPDILLTANLAVTHKGNANQSGLELWFICRGDNYLISRLSTSTGWITDSVDLDLNTRNLMATTQPWSLAIRIGEGTLDTDYLWLDKSVLSGTYSTPSVPEPNTMLLIGSLATGLLGFAGLKKRFKA